jgi:hypothetical protein
MTDSHYPTVDTSFIEQQIINTGKIIPESKHIVGKSIFFVLQGDKPFYKRLIILREITPGQINYIQATGIAIKLSFIGNLMKWYEENRAWKEGAYIIN